MSPGGVPASSALLSLEMDLWNLVSIQLTVESCVHPAGCQVQPACELHSLLGQQVPVVQPKGQERL